MTPIQKYVYTAAKQHHEEKQKKKQKRGSNKGMLKKAQGMTSGGLSGMK